MKELAKQYDPSQVEDRIYQFWLDGWVKETILGKAVAYAGTLENTAGEIKLLNYSHLDEVLA